MPVRDERLFRLEVLVRQLQRRRIVGRVAADGSKMFGDGFDSERTATGKFTVTFDSPLRSADYVVLPVPITAASGDFVAATVRTGQTVIGFSVELQDDTGALVDAAWGFEAVGV